MSTGQSTRGCISGLQAGGIHKHGATQQQVVLTFKEGNAVIFGQASGSRGANGQGRGEGANAPLCSWNAMKHKF